MKTLNLIDKAFLLKKTSLFGSLDLNLLLPIADKLQTLDIEEDETIFTYEENASRMYFIVKGEVEILARDGTILDTLSKEDFFGDESLFNEKPREYKAIALTDVNLLTLTRTNLLNIISECPSVAVGLLQEYSSTVNFRKRK